MGRGISRDGEALGGEELVGALADALRQHHQLTRSRTNAQVYKVLELYADEAALKHHGGTEYFKAAGPKMGPCMGGRPEIEYLDGV